MKTTDNILLIISSLIIGFVANSYYTSKHLKLSYITPEQVQHPLTYEIPNIVYVNNRPWHIFYNSPDELRKMGAEGATGLTDCDKLYIHILRGQEPSYERYSVHHELTHAGACLFYRQSTFKVDTKLDNIFFNSVNDWNHNGIYRYSTLWADIAWNNPKLMMYLSGK